MARILLVDDDEVARLAMGTVLEEEGHDVTYAPNGEVGLDLYRQRPFTVVLVDLIMPVMNGLQMIRELLELDKSARIIAFSGVSPEDLDMAEDLGAMRVFVKPIAPNDLLMAVNSVLRISSGWDDLKTREL